MARSKSQSRTNSPSAWPPRVSSSKISVLVPSFDRWVGLEGEGQGVDAVWDRIIAFLKSRCTYGTRTGLRKAALAMRGEVYKIAIKDQAGRQ